MKGVAILPSSEPTKTMEPRSPCRRKWARAARATWIVPCSVVSVVPRKTSEGTSSKRP